MLALQKCWRFTPDDVVLNVLPLFHIHGLCFATLLTLLTGGCVILDEFHERHLQGDLALGVVRELQDSIRPELKLVVKVAVVTLPEVPRFPWPILAPPSRKVTVPVGLAAAVVPGGVTVTVAVKVTDWPETDGLTEELSAVLVAAAFTVCPPPREAELALKLLLPL